MLRRIVVLALLASVPAISMVPMDAVAADSERSDAANALEASVKLEIKGMEALMDMWDDLTDERGDWSEEAIAAHDASVVKYEEAVKLSKAKDYKGAYQLLYEAWNLHKPATTEAVDRAPPEKVDAVLTAFIDAIDARIDALDSFIDGAPPEATQNFDAAKAAYQSAEAAHEAGNRKKATDSVNTALAELHDTFEVVARSAQNKKSRKNRGRRR